MVPDKLTQWMGFPVKNWKPADGQPDYANTIYRLAYDWDEEVSHEVLLPKFLTGEGVEETPGLSLGLNDETADTFGESVVKLVDNKDSLPKLRALFLGEMEQEDSEISWIEHGDITPIIKAFPLLEDLRVRGGSIIWNESEHSHLKKLIVESGGLSAEALAGILSSKLPELEHLEIWLGTDEYGWTGNADNVKPLLYENPFPKLKTLGLKNCDHQTEIAQLAAQAPILDQLESFDLSLGVLKDAGGEAILASEKMKGLKALNLSHNFFSDGMITRLKNSGLNVDVSDQEKVDEYDGELFYYVAVGE